MQGSSEKREFISTTNQSISKLASDDLSCTLCDKKYKTAGGLQKHLQTKHEAVQLSPQAPQPEIRILRKRRTPDEVDHDY